MAKVVVTLKIMPESPSINLHSVETKAKDKILGFVGPSEFRVTIEPIAFGLKSLNIIFVMDESKGSTDILESQIAEIAGVQSVAVTDVRRAVG